MFDKIEKYLINFEKPARYIGNELGIPKNIFKKNKVKVVISYPDIYEIGMSNLGINIIYDIINNIKYASCERVFSPWIDFEKFLRKNKFPLYSLETKTPIKQFDILGISIQYELLFSNFLNLLDLSNIELFSKNRKESDPIILCGGPSIVNPAPFSQFVDLFVIGEAEEVIKEIIKKYILLKNKNSNRNNIIKKLSEISGVYSPEYSKNIISKIIYKKFHKDTGIKNYIIPNIDIVQNKLVVEIMRGCPNKCRFCQAGVIYKPFREKSIDVIIKNINNGIKVLGVDEITFSSLSSGDYSQILILTDYFIKKYSNDKISFSLPSLRVESFDIKLLENISSVRKSGLTFAIESGSREGQLSINKEIELEKIKLIIEYAVKHGWKLIKLYFMIGLPHQNNEIEQIKSFLDNILNINRRLNINLNIAVFVPKAHTPYQYEKQLDLTESIKYFEELHNYYYRSKIKIKKHNPYMSFVEGLIARGDENIGLVAYNAFKKGAKFDGWEDKFNYDFYKQSLEELNISFNQYLSNRNINFSLPWDNIDVGLTKNYYSEELKKSENMKLSKSCKQSCDINCNICKKYIKNIIAKKININKNKFIKLTNKEIKENKITRYLIEFSKTGLLRFIGHIDTIRYFQKLFIRSNILILNTSGFNPHPKIQFSSAIPLGVISNCEVLEFFTRKNYNENKILNLLKKNQHKDFNIKKIRKIKSMKKISLFDKIEYTIYSLLFDYNDYNKIREIFNNYTNINLEYNYIKKNKTISGKYQEFISLEKLDNNRIICKVKKISPSPSIIHIVKDVFKNIHIEVVKEKMYCKDNNNFIELFSIPLI